MTRLAYFPAAYPGELLYSLLARYHQHMGAPSPILTMEALYGQRKVVASLDLPGHLQALADRLPEEAGWTVDRIIDDLTLLPYYAAFQPAAVRSRARRAMQQGRTDGLQMGLGMTAFRLGRVTRLRFCPECLSQMRERYGECYWRRDHHLPGVLVCPEHGCILRASTASISNLGRHTYVVAHQRTCPSSAPELAREVSVRALVVLWRLAQISRSLLEHPGPARSKRAWTSHYRHGVQRAGCAYSARRVDQVRLRAKCCLHYQDVIALIPGATKRWTSCEWLAPMTRKHRKAFHPLQHLLLQDFLDHQDEHVGPFGGGAWPCLNPLAKHQGLLTIDRVSIHRNHGHWVGVFRCDCGYVYTRTCHEGEKPISPPRFQNFGPLLRPELEKRILRGRSLRAIADELKLDPKTVVRLATGIGLSTPWKARAVAKKAVLGPSSRSAEPRAVADRKRPGSGPRINWRELDKSVCQKIRRAAREIINRSPPVRVSMSQVERVWWGRGWLGKRLGKLPRAAQCISGRAESLEAFRARRVRWAIREMSRTSAPLKRWRVMRMAGLPGNQAGLVEKLLAEYLARRSA